MAGATTVEELSPRNFLALRNAVERPGIRLEYDEQKARHGYNFEAGFERGVLYYYHLTPVDAITHETGHALLLTVQDRLAMKVANGDFDSMMWDYAWWAEGDSIYEETVMYLQVQMSRNIPGMGVRWALNEMDVIGYTFGIGRNHACTPYSWWKSRRRHIHRFIRENIPWL